MAHQKHIPQGVRLLNPSTFLLQCQLCNQQWSPHIAPGGAIGYKKKLCPNGCTRKLRSLQDMRGEFFEVLIEDDNIHLECIGSHADFPITSEGLNASFAWMYTNVEKVPTLPSTVYCPMCQAVFTPTPELLESTHCPACNRDFDYDDEWEESV